MLIRFWFYPFSGTRCGEYVVLFLATNIAMMGLKKLNKETLDFGRTDINKRKLEKAATADQFLKEAF